MGNLIPNGTGNVWRFSRDSISDGDENISRAKSYYSGDSPQTVYISGPLALILTLEVDNANIEVSDVGHQICLIGKGNTVTVHGAQTHLRIEGEDNKLSGDGLQIVLYADQQVSVDQLQLDASNRLTDGNGNVADEAPDKLDLDEVEVPSEMENPALIRCTYYPIPRDGKGDDDGDNKGDSDSNEVGDTPPDNGNNNNAHLDPSPGDSIGNLSTKRKMQDDDDDGEDEAPNKKLSGDFSNISI